VNLQRLLKIAYSDSRARRAISPILQKRSVKLEFGQRLIDEIVNRTQKDNVDKNGEPFEEYAESYTESKVFEIYGKSDSDVNLTLTEKMLSSMVVKNTSEGLTIEFADADQNAKAHGHIHGIKRRSKSGGLRKVRRDFFGVPQDEQIKILKSTVKDFQEDSFDFDTAAEARDSGGLS